MSSLLIESDLEVAEDFGSELTDDQVRQSIGDRTTVYRVGLEVRNGIVIPGDCYADERQELLIGLPVAKAARMIREWEWTA